MNQMILFFKSKFYSLLAGFRKNHSTEKALLYMPENWKRALAEGTVFMNLSKIVDALNRSLLLGKLKSYGFSLNLIKFVQSYLSDGFKK